MAAKAIKKAKGAKGASAPRKARKARRGKPTKRTPARAKMTGRRKPRPKSEARKRTVWQVWVEFSVKDRRPEDLDNEIERAAGKPRDGSGYHYPTQTRDHSYTVLGHVPATKMAQRLLKALASARWVTNFEVRIIRRVE